MEAGAVREVGEPAVEVSQKARRVPDPEEGSLPSLSAERVKEVHG